MSDKSIGFDTCVKTIGKDFYESYKDNSVFACGEDEKGLWCFLGINTVDIDCEELKLTNGEKWEYSVSCYVKEGVAELDEVHTPELI